MKLWRRTRPVSIFFSSLARAKFCIFNPAAGGEAIEKEESFSEEMRLKAAAAAALSPRHPANSNLACKYIQPEHFAVQYPHSYMIHAPGRWSRRQGEALPPTHPTTHHAVTLTIGRRTGRPGMKRKRQFAPNQISAGAICEAPNLRCEKKVLNPGGNLTSDGRASRVLHVTAVSQWGECCLLWANERTGAVAE